MKGRRWSASDDRTLRNTWEGYFSLRQIARNLSRTESAVYQRAKHLGLKLGRPDGSESLAAAAARTGYSRTQLKHILTWAKHPVRRAPRSRACKARYRTLHVDPFDVDDAIAEWVKAEPVGAAAKRLGMCALTLWRWVRKAGLDEAGRTGRMHLRLTEAQLQTALDLRATSRTSSPRRARSPSAPDRCARP